MFTLAPFLTPHLEFRTSGFPQYCFGDDGMPGLDSQALFGTERHAGLGYIYRMSDGWSSNLPGFNEADRVGSTPRTHGFHCRNP